MILGYNKFTKSFSVKTFSDWDQIRDLVRDTYPRIKFEKVRGSESKNSYKVKMTSNGRVRIIEVPINGGSALDNFVKASRMKVKNNLRKDINDPKVKEKVKQHKISKSGIDKRFLEPNTQLKNEDYEILASQISNLAEKDPKSLIEYVKLGSPNLTVYMEVPMSEETALKVLNELKDAGIGIDYHYRHPGKGGVLAMLAARNLTTPGTGDEYYRYNLVRDNSPSLSTEKVHEIIEKSQGRLFDTSVLSNPNITEDDLRASYKNYKPLVVGNKNCPADLINKFFKSGINKASKSDLEHVCKSPNLTVEQLNKILDTEHEYVDQAVAKSPSFKHEILERWLDKYDQYYKWEEENPDADWRAKSHKRDELQFTGGLNVLSNSESGASKSDYNLAIAAIGARTNPDYEYTYDGKVIQVNGDKTVLSRINDPRYDPDYQAFAQTLKDIYNDPNYRWRNFIHELYPSYSKLLLAFDPDENYNITPDALGRKCSEKLDKLDAGETVTKKFTPEDFGGKSKKSTKTAKELGVDQKDIDRASECDSESKAANMAKKIKDPEKLYRRAKAFISNTKFSPDPWINRAKELKLPDDKVKELESLVGNRTHSVASFSTKLIYNRSTKQFSKFSPAVAKMFSDTQYVVVEFRNEIPNVHKRGTKDECNEWKNKNSYVGDLKVMTNKRLLELKKSLGFSASSFSKFSPAVAKD